VLKKASDFSSELGKQAQKAADKISETTGQIADTAAYKKVSEVSDQQTLLKYVFDISYFPASTYH
jgi:phage-related tail protein